MFTLSNTRVQFVAIDTAHDWTRRFNVDKSRGHAYESVSRRGRKAGFYAGFGKRLDGAGRAHTDAVTERNFMAAHAIETRHHLGGGFGINVAFIRTAYYA